MKMSFASVPWQVRSISHAKITKKTFIHGPFANSQHVNVREKILTRYMAYIYLDSSYPEGSPE